MCCQRVTFHKSPCARIARVFSQDAFLRSCWFAVPSGLAAFSLETLEDHNEDLGRELTSLPDDVYKLFTTTLSMLIVFRTVQALYQYREGASCLYNMVGCFHDAASTLMSFTRISSADSITTLDFQHTVIRLFSLLSVFTLKELEDSNSETRKQSYEFSALDTESLDPITLKTIHDSHCKAEVVCQQIQTLIVDNVENGVLRVPAPILTRSFQDLSGGMTKFHESLKLTQVQVPMPLKLATYCLLLVNACGTPFVVSRWTDGAVIATCYTFLQVMVLCLLNFLSAELEHPFSGDINDIDTRRIHSDYNTRLLSLLEHGAGHPKPTTHRLSRCVPIRESKLGFGVTRSNLGSQSPGIGSSSAPLTARSGQPHDREIQGDVNAFLKRMMSASSNKLGVRIEDSCSDEEFEYQFNHIREILETSSQVPNSANASARHSFAKSDLSGASILKESSILKDTFGVSLRSPGVGFDDGSLGVYKQTVKGGTDNDVVLPTPRPESLGTPINTTRTPAKGATAIRMLTPRDPPCNPTDS